MSVDHQKNARPSSREKHDKVKRGRGEIPARKREIHAANANSENAAGRRRIRKSDSHGNWL